MRPNAWVCAILLPVLAAAGCGFMVNGRGWGQDATLSPGWDRVGNAAWNAVSAPATWVPAAGALAFQAGSADRNLAEWAARRTPVFGSRERADRASYDLRDAAGAVWVASGIIAPSGDTAGGWAYAKAAGFGVQTAGGIVMRSVVGAVKDGAGRSRPNGVDDGSFPSAHASGAAFYATLASRNIDSLSIHPAAGTAADLTLGALAGATAWARIEAYQHFPSDVLSGIALGHFFGAFVTDAFLGLENPRNAILLIEPTRHGTVAVVRFFF